MDNQNDLQKLKKQVEELKAILELTSEEDRPTMLTVIEDLENVIKTFTAPDGSVEVRGSSSSAGVEIDDEEFELFQKEIASITKEFESSESDSEDDEDDSADENSLKTEIENGENVVDDKRNCINDELEALEGMKCLAPHEESWGQIGYYPAMISQVMHNENSNEEGESANDMASILVRVVFLQPVVKSQVLCPFYQEDKCRFDETDCRYSHGEVVSLSKLREYSEPDFSKVIPNARVLAKYTDNIWYKATVTRLTSEGNCEVQFDRNEELCEIGIHETNAILSETDSSDSDDPQESEEDEEESSSSRDFQSSSNVLLNMTATNALGSWEKHTKGFGSRLMLKMGYVMGSGLGKQAEGRVEPVDAVIVPLGMSLDKWMEIKEKRKQHGENWFSVEKKLKRAQKRHAHREKIQKQNEPKSVFDFMNTKLFLSKSKREGKSQQKQTVNLVKQTTLNLKKEMLSIGESVKKVNKDILKIKQSMKRIEGRDPATLAAMKAKLEELEKTKDELSRKEKRICEEQKSRSDKKKLLEF